MTDSSAARVAVIVVAAGDGTRLGADKPKAFVDLAGKPILAHALDAIFGMNEPAQVIVVVPGQLLSQANQLVADIAGAAASYTQVVVGGDSRQDSVAAGVRELADTVQVVLVHDAARALAPTELFERVIAEVDGQGVSIIPGLPVSDTIKKVDASGSVVSTVDRTPLHAVQTPQGFPRSHLDAGYAAASVEFTDDAALVAAAGLPVLVIKGEGHAFKITTGWDLRRAEQLLVEAGCAGAPASNDSTAVRLSTGIALDVHAYADTSELWLAGLHWPGERGLAGHSDGDAVCHALSDALLSAAGLGDMGGVFGTSSPKWENARGEAFLRETLKLVVAAGFGFENGSVQVIGNSPRFAPRRDEAQARLSGILGGPVSISATTTDSLGFTGRGEGIAAIATVLLRRPH